MANFFGLSRTDSSPFLSKLSRKSTLIVLNFEKMPSSFLLQIIKIFLYELGGILVFVIKTIYLQVEDLTHLMAFIVEVKIITLISDIPQVIGKQNLSSDVSKRFRQ